MELAVRGNARSHDLAEAVDIVSVDSQLTLYLGSHFLSPRLCSVDGCLQLNLVLDPHLLNGFRNMKKVGGRTHDSCHPEIHHHGDQLLGVACGHGDHGGSHLLCTVMGSQASGKQTVPVSHLDDVIASQSGHGNAPGHALAPHVDVLACISHHRGLSGGAAGRVDAGNLGIGHRKHAEGVCVSQIVLCGKWKLFQILDSPDISRLQSHCLHFLAVILHTVVHSVN